MEIQMQPELRRIQHQEHSDKASGLPTGTPLAFRSPSEKVIAIGTTINSEDAHNPKIVAKILRGLTKMLSRSKHIRTAAEILQEGVNFSPELRNVPEISKGMNSILLFAHSANALDAANRGDNKEIAVSTMYAGADALHIIADTALFAGTTGGGTTVHAVGFVTKVFAMGLGGLREKE